MSFSSGIPLWLDGREVITESTFEVISPNTGKPIYKSSSASVADAEKAIESAAASQEAWAATKPSVRRDVFLRAAEGFLKRRDELYKITQEETGAAESMFDFEFNLAVEGCKNIAGLIPVATRGIVPTPSEDGKSAIVIREPYGVVLSIAPWNAPYVLGLRACLGPLAMGNAVILKGAEASPGAYWAIASILHEAGLPKGCLNTVVHRPEDAAAVTSAIISSPHVRKITFTGSTATGSIIASQAARLLKPTLMELGGKAPTIVCQDADVQQAALGCALGAFLHSGQICMSTERIIVHADVAESFKKAFGPTVNQVFGETQSMTLISDVPVRRNKNLLEDAINKGAVVIHGDANHSDDRKSAMRPVIIENVTRDMDIYHNESFGPTVSLYTVNSDEEAIELANDTDYGLAAAIYTEDLRRGLRLAKKIKSGAVHINGMSVHDETSLPHGGFKKSGYGRFNGLEGLEEWVQTKTITWKD
jgi:acyl-CoA reductase-like NAD-dependent aldehyde dehydrogenase